MKKRLLIMFICFLLLATLGLSAENARYQAMGGAFTAVGDDDITIKANPAGLAYITDNELKFSTTVNVNPSFNLFTYDFQDIEEFGDIWPYQLYYHYDTGEIGYNDWENGNNEFTNTVPTGTNAGETFNSVLEQMGFIAAGETPDYDTLWEMQSWFELVSFMDILNDGFISMDALPSISMVDWNIGISYDRGYSVNGTPDSTDNEIDLVSSSEIAGGLARSIGSLSLGVNAVYSRSSTVTIDTPEFNEYGTYSDLIDSAYGIYDPDMIPLEAIFGNLFDEGEKTSELTIGMGAMVNLGAFTVGAALDDLEALLAQQGSVLSDDRIEAALDQMNVGLAYESNRRKTDQYDDFINLLVAADIHNLGDIDSRTLHMGAELGLSIAEWITADVRAGYSQDLDVDLDYIMDNGLIDYEKGEISFGIGTKLLVAQLDMAVSLPSVFAQMAFMNSFSDDYESFEEAVATLDPLSGPEFTITGSLVF